MNEPKHISEILWDLDFKELKPEKPTVALDATATTGSKITFEQIQAEDWTRWNESPLTN